MRIVIAGLLVAAVLYGGGLLERGPRQDATGPPRTATVARIVDGDTVVLAGVGKARLIGVDTPVLWSQHVIRAAVRWEQRR